MKATLRLMIAAAVLVSAQMSHAADAGAVKPPCPFADKAGGLVKTNFEPPTKPVVVGTSGQSAS